MYNDGRNNYKMVESCPIFSKKGEKGIKAYDQTALVNS
jgi:hypothetical protein